MGDTRKAFVVENINLYDPSTGPPENGMDYLRSVIQERRQLPKVIVSEIDPRKYDDRRTKICYEKPKEPPLAPFDLLPTEEWQNTILTEFEKFRDEIREKEEEELKSDRLVPHHNDLQGWQRICIGTKSNPDDSSFLKLAEKPVMETLVLINELTVVKLIHYHTLWIEDSEITETNTDWLYSLFAKLEEPILDNTAADIRKILNTCCTKRAALTSKDDPFLPYLNKLITIITQYFGQVESYSNEEDPFSNLLRTYTLKKRWRSRMWEENLRKKPRIEDNSIPINLADFLGNDDDEENLSEEEQVENGYNEEDIQTEHVVPVEDGNGEANNTGVIENQNQEYQNYNAEYYGYYGQPDTDSTVYSEYVTNQGSSGDGSVPLHALSFLASYGDFVIPENESQNIENTEINSVGVNEEIIKDNNNSNEQTVVSDNQ